MSVRLTSTEFQLFTWLRAITWYMSLQLKIVTFYVNKIPFKRRRCIRSCTSWVFSLASFWNVPRVRNLPLKTHEYHAITQSRHNAFYSFIYCTYYASVSLYTTSFYSLIFPNLLVYIFTFSRGNTRECFRFVVVYELVTVSTVRLFQTLSWTRL